MPVIASSLAPSSRILLPDAGWHEVLSVELVAHGAVTCLLRRVGDGFEYRYACGARHLVDVDPVPEAAER